ncbi:MAG: hypothetical protein K6T86_17170 [Pirellulales bacterium]|nr:hypothetical protein [Pirellulales bacterium]
MTHVLNLESHALLTDVNGKPQPQSTVPPLDRSSKPSAETHRKQPIISIPALRAAAKQKMPVQYIS